MTWTVDLKVFGLSDNEEEYEEELNEILKAIQDLGFDCQDEKATLEEK